VPTCGWASIDTTKAEERLKRHFVRNVADIDLIGHEVGVTTPQGRKVLPYVSADVAG
jgi:hypothetical protein